MLRIDLQNTSKLKRKKLIANGILQTLLDARTLNKDAYFITFTEGMRTTKQKRLIK